METFAERLRKLMASVGLSEESMAKLLGVSLQKIENLVTGYTSPDMNQLVRFAQVFNVSLEYMALKSEDPVCREPEFAKEVYVADNLRPGDGMVMLENIVDTVYINRDELRGRDFYGLIVKDDSMVKARIFKDDTLIICRQNYVDNGDIVVAMVDGQSEVIRRYNRKGNIVTLSSEGDMMKYKTIKINTDEVKLEILGKVHEVRIKNF